MNKAKYPTMNDAWNSIIDEEKMLDEINKLMVFKSSNGFEWIPKRAVIRIIKGRKRD
jgi:hypothetical protein